MRVVVIGAGLGGLALAHGLTRRGVDVEVYERDTSAEVRGQGARFHIDERGIAALRACLPGAQFALFEATLGQPSTNLTVLDDRLEVVSSQPFAGREGLPDDVRPGRSASRRLVRRLLAHGLDVRFGKELVRFDQGSFEQDSGVRAHFADGTTAHGDVLVGADGIGSAVRRQYLPHAAVVDTGVRWLGGKTPLTPGLLATGLPDRIKGSFTATQVGDVRMIVAAMRFQEPPAQVAARLLPGFDPGDSQDYLMWALVPPRIDGPLWEFAKAATAQAHPALRRVVADAWPDQCYALEMGMAEPVDVWPPSNVTVLGDAIHAMLPSRGSGANTALQDAARLAAALAAPDLLTAIEGYEHQLRRDGFEAVQASMRFG
ncbi:FAD-dependent oxidoreductase [Pseudonocardia sp. TRM90224]|uniref:FAD-dependent oxidoreductase n=1 Tax=Pseudonocardia sp. TRM90224 TaxID=2812678 RepID=UPI001E4EE177|nr:FAD-dependent monooxygenase [Pseudonocardia sp. TRM90224]